MAILYFKNPADGLWYPILGSDVSDKADTTYVDNELDKKLDKAGGVATGNVDINNVHAGLVWGGLYRGIQQDDSVEADSAALLLGNSEKGGITYLIGNIGQKVVIRPDAGGGSTYDYLFQTDGLYIPQDDPTHPDHAVSKKYADNPDKSSTSISLNAGFTGAIWVRKQGGLVSIQVDDLLWSTPSSSWTEIGTVPAGYRPHQYIVIPLLYASSGTGPYWMTLNVNGLLQAAPWNTWVANGLRGSAGYMYAS